VQGRAGAAAAAQRLDPVDVLLLRVGLCGALELFPGFVLGGAYEVEEAGLGTADVALGALLVQRVQAQQGVVVGAVGQRLDVFGGLFERGLDIGHGEPLLAPG